MEKDIKRRTLSIEKACEETGVSRRTIYNWINSGKLEWMRTIGGSIRIYADSLFKEGETSKRDEAKCACQKGKGLSENCPVHALAISEEWQRRNREGGR